MRDARAKRRSEHFPLETAEGTNSPRSAANSFISPGASARLNGVSIHALLAQDAVLLQRSQRSLPACPRFPEGNKRASFQRLPSGILRGAVQPGIAGGRSDDCAGTGAALGGSKRHPETARHPVKVAHQLRFDALGQEVGHCKSEFIPRLEMPIYGYAIIRQLDEHRRAVERH